MMFLSLINTLVLEAEIISILINPRLFYIYKRSFEDQITAGQVKIYTHQDFARLKISHLSFDYQVPLGSICQHRFTCIEAYAPVVPILRADVKKSQSLKNKYMADNSHTNSSTKLIGISWRGGGRPDRIKAKSIEFDDFTSILKSAKDCRFIILQYGDCEAEFRLWKKEGIDVVYDRSINPLKDMDNWLNQVAACDAVLSVANTTIHGAGGLNIPTYCLLDSRVTGVGLMISMYCDHTGTPLLVYCVEIQSMVGNQLSPRFKPGWLMVRHIHLALFALMFYN